jgi:hypothetical protein
MSLSSSARVIYSAATANGALVLATAAFRGWNSAGIHAVARNSARFSALWFMVAFAAPGLGRFIRGLPTAKTLLWAWCAAHMVHFASVAILPSIFERQHVEQHTVQSLLVVLIGSSFVFGATLIAASDSLLHTVLHNISLYAVFVLFTLSFIHNRVPSLRLLAVALGLALLVRVSAYIKSAKATPFSLSS